MSDELKPLETLGDVINWALRYLDIRFLDGECLHGGCSTLAPFTCRNIVKNCTFTRNLKICKIAERKPCIEERCAVFDDCSLAKRYDRCYEKQPISIVPPHAPAWSKEPPTEPGIFLVAFEKGLVWPVLIDGDLRVKTPGGTISYQLSYFADAFAKFWLKIEVPALPEEREWRE